MLRSIFARRSLGVSTHSLSSTTSIKSTSQFTSRGFTSSRFRSQGQQQQTEQPSAYRSGMAAFRPFGAPFVKVFLGAIFTYQVIYYAWMRLETSEQKLIKNAEIKGLEKEARGLAASAK